MNCAYHVQNVANVQCNGCGKPLCPTCDHRIKGFPYCQDCIVLGVDLLRQQNHTNHVPFVKKRTSPFVATILSMMCPGLGAAYNGQTVKALVHFLVFVGLFQLASVTGMVMFAFGSIGMWFFAALDAWRTAHTIRSGLTPDMAEDILVKRFSGNPKLWGIVLTVLGALFLLQRFDLMRGLVRGLVPLMLIGLGIYLLRGYIFKSKTDEQRWRDYDGSGQSATFATALSEPRYKSSEFENRSEARFGGWRGQ
ncbi:MAG TPA: DUF5668 domain-containing protein [Pyrinomonadaceae bacterium]|nr:DUF5668 domain-containing protein [Pyrinomonadaceae bacterium]